MVAKWWMGTILALMWKLALAPAVAQTSAAPVAPAFEWLDKQVVGVAVIRDREGCCAGLVLDANGTILTDIRAVVGLYPAEVEAMVQGAGVETREVFKGFRVIGVHPDVDLALIRVNGTGLVPVKRSAEAAKVGSRVWVFGHRNAGDGKQALRQVPTEVVEVTTENGQPKWMLGAFPKREMFGSAVVDKELGAVGIVTSWRWDDKIGYASIFPLTAFKATDFIPLDKRNKSIYERKIGGRTDVDIVNSIQSLIDDRARRAARRGVKVSMVGESEDEEWRYFPYASARQAIAQAPDRWQTFRDVAVDLMEAGVKTKALLYASKMVEIAPADKDALSQSQWVFGKFGEYDRIVDNWVGGLAKGLKELPYPSDALPLEESRKRAVDVAYCLAWSYVNQKNKDWLSPEAILPYPFSDAMKLLPPDVRAVIRAKRGEFSMDELKRLRAADAATRSPAIEKPAFAGAKPGTAWKFDLATGPLQSAVVEFGPGKTSVEVETGLFTWDVPVDQPAGRVEFIVFVTPKDLVENKEHYVRVQTVVGPDSAGRSK